MGRCHSRCMGASHGAHDTASRRQQHRVASSARASHGHARPTKGVDFWAAHAVGAEALVPEPAEIEPAADRVRHLSKGRSRSPESPSTAAAADSSSIGTTRPRATSWHAQPGREDSRRGSTRRLSGRGPRKQRQRNPSVPRSGQPSDGGRQLQWRQRACVWRLSHMMSLNPRIRSRHTRGQA